MGNARAKGTETRVNVRRGEKPLGVGDVADEVKGAWVRVQNVMELK